MLPPLKPLLSFKAAAKYQSFTKAAHELNITHGAVSRSVKQLEDYFGFELFERRNRGLFLTSRGKKLAAEVEIILANLEMVCEKIRMSESESKRILSVSCEPSLAMRWLMPELDEFRTAFPHIDIHLSVGGGPINLSSEGVNLAIRRSDFRWPSDYHCTVLGKELVGPVCSPAYWEKHRDKAKQILHTRTRPEAWNDWNRLSDSTIEACSEKYFDHFYFSLQAAATGFGVAIGPEPLVRGDLEHEILIAPYGFIVTPINYVLLSLGVQKENSDIIAFTNWLTRKLALPVAEDKT